MEKEKKMIELWNGYSVPLDERMADDFSFVRKYNKALKEDDLETIIALTFNLVGGEKVYDTVEGHIVAEKGYFSSSELRKILAKIGDAIPKAQ